MAKKMNPGTSTLSAEIRRQLGTESMARYLRSLPAFRVQDGVPKRFADLLERLEEAETSAGHRLASGSH